MVRGPGTEGVVVELDLVHGIVLRGVGPAASPGASTGTCRHRGGRSSSSQPQGGYPAPDYTAGDAANLPGSGEALPFLRSDGRAFSRRLPYRRRPSRSVRWERKEAGGALRTVGLRGRGGRWEWSPEHWREGACQQSALTTPRPGAGILCDRVATSATGTKCVAESVKAIR